jgi:hypothetical protein
MMDRAIGIVSAVTLAVVLLGVVAFGIRAQIWIIKLHLRRSDGKKDK